jgi:pantoate kinase
VARSRRVRAIAFAPGHVTGIFAPAAHARDPRARGSTGAGVVLELGSRAVAEFRPGERRAVRISSDLNIPLPISEDVARRLFPRDRGVLSVHLTHELPVGQGFGMSAAGATATALAVGAIAGRARAESIAVAHLAELFHGGGLGGVAAIADGGGLEYRQRAGLPPRGRTVHRALGGRLFVGVVGGSIPSPNLLRNASFLARVERASRGLNRLLARPGAPEFFDLSERFTDRLGLAPPAVRRVLRALRSRGAWASQAMFGRSFFARVRSPGDRSALVEWLESSGLRAVELAPARRGAHLVGYPVP